MVKPEKLISEAILIAGAPLLGYAIGFAYEYGYAEYYEIPWQFISLSLSQVLVAAAALIGLLGILLVVYNPVFIIFAPERRQHPFVVSFWRLIPFSVLLCALVLIFGARWREWAGAALVTIGAAGLGWK